MDYGSSDDQGGVIEDRYSSSFRTKLKIAKVCNALCKEKSFEKVSVDEIVKRAGISRSGFYYHFQDKNSIVIWLSKQCYSVGLDETGRTLTWFEGHLRTTRLFQEYNALFVSGAENREYMGGQPFYVRRRQKFLTETLTDYQHKQLTPLLEFQIQALPHAEMAMANRFIAGEFDLKIKDYCNMAVSLVPRELYEALATPVNPSTSDQGSFF